MRHYVTVTWPDGKQVGLGLNTVMYIEVVNGTLLVREGGAKGFVVFAASPGSWKSAAQHGTKRPE